MLLGKWVVKWVVVILTVFGIGLSLLGVPVWAEVDGAESDSFVMSIQAALRNNPRTMAAAAQLKASQERDPQSLSQLLPTVDMSANRTHTRTEWSGGHLSSDPFALGVTVTQNLFNQKALVGLRQTRPFIASYEYDLHAVIQGVFLDTASAIVDLLQFMEVARLASNNRDLLKHHLQATRSRFDVGEITRTDVSQAESRLAVAEANLVRAGNAVAVGRARFRELTGELVPEGLHLPGFREGLMEATLTELQARIDARPELVAARLRLQLATEEIEMKRAGHYPTVGLTAKASRSWNDESIAGVDVVNRYSMDLGLSMPIYAGGLVASQVTEALARKEAQEAEVERLQRTMTKEVEAALLDLQSAKAANLALTTGLRAANEALDGVEREHHVGTRTALDLLDAQNEAFSAQTELAKSRFGIVLSQFRLLYSMGQLTVDALVLSASQPKSKLEEN